MMSLPSGVEAGMARDETVGWRARPRSPDAERYAAQARDAGRLLIRQVDAILPELAARRAETDAAGCLSQTSVDALRGSGIMRALTPRQWGGMEVDPVSFYEAVIRIASACPSSGWVGGILNVHSWQVALMDPAFQAEFWRDSPDACASSAYAPTGAVQRAPGGFLLSGRWHFSSGVDVSDWAIVGAVIPDGEGGKPEFRSFAVAKADLAVDDASWDVAGMKGTGSKSLVMQNAFVPEHRTHRVIDEYADTNPGYTVNDRPLYRFGRMGIFWTTIACVAVGAATGGLNAFLDDTRVRVNRLGTGTPVAENPFLQLRLANGLLRVEGVRQRLGLTWNAIYDRCCQGEPPSRLQRVRARFEAADANAASFEGFAEVYANAGGSAAAMRNPLQLFFRDLMTMRNHGTAAREQLATVYMQALLGQEPPPFDQSVMHTLLYHG